MTGKPIRGVLPIVHTPFTERDAIDWTSFARQVDWARGVGADGFCTGMVSELLRLTAGERCELTEKLAECNAGRRAVVAGVGAESTKQAIEYARVAERAACDAVMAIPPISTALPADALLAYFSAIADCVSIPLIVQDASSYVGQAIPIAVHVELVRRFGPDKILFKPEAPPLGPNVTALREATDHRARIFEGSGGMALVDSHRRGVAGTMPGMEFLEGILALWNALERNDDDAAYRIAFPIGALVAIQIQAGLDGFLAIEKYVLNAKGLFATDRRREPYAWSLDEETRLEVDRLRARLDEAVRGDRPMPR
ncbi:MAG: dihydrodipicolinate synthase family protein [Planctomycetes bacterium]|nr:dihydrodipicolinate synthase family protein [Planctomycetota bacterium]